MLQLSKRDKIGIALIVGIAAITIAGVIFVSSIGEDLDKFGCPVDRKVGHTLILVDKTDPFTENQQMILRNLLKQFKQELDLLQVHEKLSIYILDGSNYIQPKPAFTSCRPKSEEEANIIIENPRILKENYDKRYAEPLEKAIATLLEGSRADVSPLLEMLREISILRDFQQDYPRRRLIIFSDMIHNTEQFSMYNARTDLSYDDAKKKSASYFELTRPQFSGSLPVSLYILRREAYKSAPLWGVVKQFWKTYFSDHGVSLSPDLICGPPKNYSEGCVYVEL